MYSLRRIKAKAKKWTSLRARSSVSASNDTPNDLEHSSEVSVQALAHPARENDDGQAQIAAVSRIEEQTHPSPVPRTSSPPVATSEEVSTGIAKSETENDLWGQAFSELSQKQQAQLSALVKSDVPDSQPAKVTADIIPDLIAVTKKRQEECEKKFWRVRLGKGPGDEIILREQAAQIISWLTLAGDIGVQFAPSLVGQVWPAIKALLKIPVGEAEQMAAVLKVADKVSRLVARGRVFEGCYNMTNTKIETLRNLHTDLMAIYKAGLAILATASGLLENNLVERTVHSILHPGAITNEVGVSLPELEAQLAYDVQAAESARRSEITDELLSRLQKLDAPIVRIDERVAQVLEAVDVGQEQKILEWISPLPYSSYHDLVSEKRMPDTCDWILRDLRFQEWERSSGCALMWLWGFSGTGKTFLTSKVVDYKIGLLNSSPNDEAVVFFYFNRSDSARNSALACLRSLVRQFSTCRSRQGHIQSSFKKLYEECVRCGRSMTWELCKKQITESLNLFPRSTIIIDALDECDEDDRPNLVQILNEMMKTSRRPLMIFISSRPDGDIKNAFRDRVNVEIGVKDNQDDIARFVRGKVKNNLRWAKFSEETKERVVTTLIEQSQAMFLWAALQIYELLKLQIEEDVNDRLGMLPKDLKTTYDDIYLRQIQTRGDTASAIAERAIMWLLVAFEPLTSEHLLSAVRIDAGRYKKMFLEPVADVPRQKGNLREHAVEWITEEVDDELLLELCANLLTFDSATRKWNFVHASVLEYFQVHHFSDLHAHAYVGFTSLMVIIDATQGPILKQSLVPEDGENGQENEEDGSEDEEISSYKPNYHSLFRGSLVAYAVGHWGDHISLVDKGVNTLKKAQGCTFERDAYTMTKALRVLLQRFLGHPNNSSSEYRVWQRAFDRWICHGGEDVFGSDSQYELSEINFGQRTDVYASLTAVYYGFFNMLPTWWKGSCHEHDGGNCPTCDACSWPSIDTTVILEGHNWSLLAIAAYFGHARIVDALLSMGMDANSGTNSATFSKSTMPLSLASEQGFIEVCKILIRHCQPDRPSGIDDALYLAAQESHLHIVHYLLSAGADPNFHFEDILGRSDTVVALAARKNNTDVLRIILEDNRDQPRAHLPSQSELLHAAIDAAYHLSLDALQCLVFNGHVDPNARKSDQRFQTILLAAAHDIKEWSSSVYRCLRECGVDFKIQKADLCRLRESQQYYGNTLLEAAVLTGDVDVIKVAVEEWGEDVNMISEDSKKSRHGCALITAVEQGHLEAVQYLLKMNADANCQVPKAQSCHTPLSVALTRGHFAVADALIQHGADVNMPIKYGLHGSALTAAASHKTVDALRFAINAGALINAPLKYGSDGSALICAIIHDHKDNVQYLLDHGADINCRATVGQYASALTAASFFRDREMVSFLIERGADVNRPENHGWEEMLEGRARLPPLVKPVSANSDKEER